MCGIDIHVNLVGKEERLECIEVAFFFCVLKVAVLEFSKREMV